MRVRTRAEQLVIADERRRRDAVASGAHAHRQHSGRAWRRECARVRVCSRLLTVCAAPQTSPEWHNVRALLGAWVRAHASHWVAWAVAARVQQLNGTRRRARALLAAGASLCAAAGAPLVVEYASLALLDDEPLHAKRYGVSESVCVCACPREREAVRKRIVCCVVRSAIWRCSL
jgi:hypothetical protein